jgi:hypothetical protein
MHPDHEKLRGRAAGASEDSSRHNYLDDGLNERCGVICRINRSRMSVVLGSNRQF